MIFVHVHAASVSAVRFCWVVWHTPGDRRIETTWMHRARNTSDGMMHAPDRPDGDDSDMNSKILAVVVSAFTISSVAAPPTPAGNPPSTPGPNTGEVGGTAKLPSSGEVAAGEDGFVIVKGQVFRLSKGRATPVKEEVTVKIAPTAMSVKVSPNGITGLDGKPFELPAGEMLSISGRLVPRPTGIAGLPAGGTQTQERAGQPRTPTPAADTINRSGPGPAGAAPAGQAAPEGLAGRAGAPAIPGPDKPSNAQGSGGYPGGPLNGGEQTEKKKK